MLQDLEFGKLDNTFREMLPQPEDTVLCFRDGEVLLCRKPDDTLLLPTYRQVSAWATSWQSWKEDTFRYVFNLQGINCFQWMGQAGDCPDGEFVYEPGRPVRQLQSKNICFAIMNGWAPDHNERMLLCPNCGNMIFPKISPAVIIAVTDGDRLLLSKYAGRSYTRYALLAGYTEIGETLEETVQRETMEEVGLKVKNIRFYKSQPWGVDGNILMGFFCDLDGSDQIRLDENELSMAGWFSRNDLPAHDDGISLTREMIRIFEEGREPRGKK